MQGVEIKHQLSRYFRAYFFPESLSKNAEQLLQGIELQE